MKKNYTTKIFIAIAFLFCCISFSSKAQMYYMPDFNLRFRLTNLGYGSCLVPDSIDASCLGPSDDSLDLSASGIISLEGIQAFQSLTYLNCAGSVSFIPPWPNTLTYLDCSYNELDSLPSWPPALTFLNCTSLSFMVSTLPPLPATLKTLYCGRGHLDSLPALPDSLTILYCDENQLTSLPSLPVSLRHLECQYNLIDSIAALPDSLTLLFCHHNLLTTLPALPASLTQLLCHNNHLASLPALPAGLFQFHCYNNQLTSLPALPATCLNFACYNNQLTSLPALPPLLEELWCFNNQLTSLPVLTSSLTDIYCQHNQLTSLPALPVSLNYLTCDHNQLTSLPVLPSGLTSLDCGHNQLTSLPPLPHALYNLYCENNQLNNIPALPGFMSILQCDSNPTLNCLPQLTQITNLSFNGTGVTCLPNYGNVFNSQPLLSSLPLCGVFNPDGCNFEWNISGRSYLDINANCIFDSTDGVQRNTHIFLFKNGNLLKQIFTTVDGLYAFDQLDTGSYIVQYDTICPFDVLCPLTGLYNDTITQSDSIFYNDFSFQCKPGFDLGVQSIEARFRPAAYSTVHIAAGDIALWYGQHCAFGVSGTVTVYFTGPVNYIGPAAGALTPMTSSGNALIYNISDFGVLNYSDFDFVLQTDTNAALGADVCISVIASSSSIQGDNNPSNDTLIHCIIIRNSFDPNDKEASPASDIDINGNHWLTYTIRFQNTGTAPAENIYILDTLDGNLDLSTFQLLAYSQQPSVLILEGGIARFNFLNINLPDSNANEPASHGYVQYRIKLNNGLAVGTQVHNTAYIYFDFNAPVVTNTTENTLQLITHISSGSNNDLQVSVYPNPSRSEFMVYCSQFPAGKKVLLKLYDALGNELLNEKMTASNFTLHTSQFPAGIYFLKIESENGMVMKKLVKE